MARTSRSSARILTSISQSVLFYIYTLLIACCAYCLLTAYCVLLTALHLTPCIPYVVLLRYNSQKKYYAVQMLAVALPNLAFSYVHIGTPGE